MGTWPDHGTLGAASALRQAERAVIRVPSHAMPIGLGHDAQLVGGMVLLERVDNLIVRSLHFSDACEHNRARDPNNNTRGEWNSVTTIGGVRAGLMAPRIGSQSN